MLLTIIGIGIIPIITLLLQNGIAGLHARYNHYSKCKLYTPRVAILIPCWNEQDVIQSSLERLVSMDYPSDKLRIYVIDDASTDFTYEIVHSVKEQYPDNIFYIKREKGGLGKAHVINSGLDAVLSDSWAEAIMITDADVIFEKNAIQQMTRHLADPEIGAITIYIRVSQLATNFITNSIAYEYIVSQSIARRAQNVTRAFVCLAGGAQMHTRENIELLGGKIDTTTLAEDTYTTFLTQINRKRAIFEGHSVVNAKEPDNILALWRQRFRWARGNIQITLAFRHLWFRIRDPSKLGGIFFGLTWFSTLLIPIFMITTSISLILLFFIDQNLAWALFRIFYSISAVAYLFATLLSFAIDSGTMKRAWFAAILFPGLISLSIMTASIVLYYNPPAYSSVTNSSLYGSFNWQDALLLFMAAWTSLCMFFAWVVYRLALLGVPDMIINILLMFVGYGPLLCANTLLAFIAEMRSSSTVWHKTEKTNLVVDNIQKKYIPRSFEKTLEKDIRAEHKLIRDELLILIFLFFLFIIIPLTNFFEAMKS